MLSGVYLFVLPLSSSIICFQRSVCVSLSFLCIRTCCLHRWYSERGVSLHSFSLQHCYQQHKICCVYHKISWLCICLLGVKKHTHMQYANTHTHSAMVATFIYWQSFHMPFHYDCVRVCVWREKKRLHSSIRWWCDCAGKTYKCHKLSNNIYIYFILSILVY